MSEICSICDDNKVSQNLNCYTCKNTICIDCCNKLNYKKYLFYKLRKEVFLKYSCPFCRAENNKNIKLFNKNELSTFIVDLLSQHINLNENIDNLTNQNNELKTDINKKNKYITDIVKVNKNNMREFDILLNKYKYLFNLSNY